MNDERDRRITARAFELWQKEGAPDGRALIHWLQAEKEIADAEADKVVADESPITAQRNKFESDVEVFKSIPFKGSTPH